MRQKAMPISIRQSAPREPERPPTRPRLPRRKSRFMDWILTVPVLLLVPAIVVPLIVASAASPTLRVEGHAAAGARVHVSGLRFPAHATVLLRWDGSDVAWLPPTGTDRRGQFREAIRLPASMSPGNHRVDAVVKGNDESPVATATVNIGTSSNDETAAATATSSGSQAGPTATEVPTPTAAVTAAPTAVPATPAPTSVPTAEPTPAPPPPASTGVVGYGARTAGGSGGSVIAVTNLADSGAGSLRAALSAQGSRTVVFRVGGTISLGGDIVIKNPYLTVAGETAPAPVVIKGGAVKVNTHDVILRYLRMRPGDEPGSTTTPANTDAVTINGMTSEVYNVVLDHLTMLWAPDIGGLAVLGNVHDVTIQNSIMGEGLYLSRHPEATAAAGGHSMAMNATQLDPSVHWPTRLTMVHNLFTTSNTRMPRFEGAECVDLVNNVIYNWGSDSAHGNPRSINVVGNWFRSGPLTTRYEVWRAQPSTVTPNLFSASVYLAGNSADGFQYTVNAPASQLSGQMRCGGLSVGASAATNAYSFVLSNVGAVRPWRDTVDARIINNVVNRSGQYFNGVGYPAPNPYWP
jgi:pectate lyase